MSAKSANTKRPSPIGAERTLPLPINAEEVDRKAEAGEDINDYLDWDKMEVLEPEVQRVEFDLPEWVVASLDETAAKLGTTREALIRERLVASVTPSSP